MKKILLTLACLLGAITLSAQSTPDNSQSEKLVTIGIRAGLNIANYSGHSFDGLKSKCGFVGGISADFALSKYFYINSGLFLSMNGAKYNGYSEKINLSPIYLKIPVMPSLRYRFNKNVQWQLNFGPYFAYGIGGKAQVDLKGIGKADEDFFSEEGGGKRFDVGLGVGTGITYKKVYFGLEYNFGLTSIGRYDDVDGKNRAFAISLGYNF